MLVGTGDFKGALETYRKGLVILQRLADAGPTNAQAQGDLSNILAKIGVVLKVTGDTDGAIESYGKALKVAEALVKLDPNDATAKETLAKIQGSLAKCRQPATAASHPASAPATIPAGQ